ncbi:MAG: flagellar export chaperone FlgN [Phycisphaerae bacterium]
MAATNSDSAAQQDSPHEVLILLRAQRQLYVKLEAIAEKQRGFITGDNSSELLTILADRQRVSKALAEIGQRLAPAREHWDSFVTAFNHEQREEAETIIASIRGSLQRVMERDDMDVKLLAARKHVVSKAMEATHNSRRAVHAYGSSGGGRSGDRLNQST